MTRMTKTMKKMMAPSMMIWIEDSLNVHLILDGMCGQTEGTDGLELRTICDLHVLTLVTLALMFTNVGIAKVMEPLMK